MRRLSTILLTAVIAACSSGGVTTSTTHGTIDPAAAREFAASADRALDGTRFELVPTADLGDAIVDLCESQTSLAIALPEVIEALEAPPGPASDDAIMREVLLTGVAELCPQRGQSDVTAAYLASVRLAIADVGGVVVPDEDALRAGLSACIALTTNDPRDGVVSIAAALFDVEASYEELQAGAIGDDQALTIGAVLGAAVVFLCPEHRDVVEGTGETAG